MSYRRFYFATIMVLTVVGTCLAVGCFLVMKVTSCRERATELAISRFAELLAPSRISLSDRNNWSPSRFFDDPKVVDDFRHPRRFHDDSRHPGSPRVF